MNYLLMAMLHIYVSPRVSNNQMRSNYILRYIKYHSWIPSTVATHLKLESSLKYVVTAGFRRLLRAQSLPKKTAFLQHLPTLSSSACVESVSRYPVMFTYAPCCRPWQTVIYYPGKIPKTCCCRGFLMCQYIYIYDIITYIYIYQYIYIFILYFIRLHRL